MYGYLVASISNYLFPYQYSTEFEKVYSNLFLWEKFPIISDIILYEYRKGIGRENYNFATLNVLFLYLTMYIFIFKKVKKILLVVKISHIYAFLN